MNFIRIFQTIQLFFYQERKSFSYFTPEKQIRRPGEPDRRIYLSNPITLPLHGGYRGALLLEPQPASPAQHLQVPGQS